MEQQCKVLGVGRYLLHKPTNEVIRNVSTVRRGGLNFKID